MAFEERRVGPPSSLSYILHVKKSVRHAVTWSLVITDIQGFHEMNVSHE